MRAKHRSPEEIAKVLQLAPRHDFLVWKRFLALVDYKPGWALEVLDQDFIHYGKVVLHIKMLVHDTFEQRDLKPIVVTTKYEVPSYLHPSQMVYSSHDVWLGEALSWLRRQIHAVEMHEADEWLRFDGLQKFNPHGEPQQLGRRPEGWEWLAPPEIAIAPTLKVRSGKTTTT